MMSLRPQQWVSDMGNESGSKERGVLKVNQDQLVGSGDISYLGVDRIWQGRDRAVWGRNL